MRTAITLCAAAALTALAACSSNTTVVRNTPTVVSVPVNGTDTDLVRASQVAARTCSDTGRTASLTDISTVNGDRIASFQCVGRL